MRFVVVGASGNVGTALLRRLAREEQVDAVTGVARRVPGPDAGAPYDGVDWHAVDVGAPDAVSRLTDVFAGAGVVVHLAWQIQPSHDRRAIRRTNVTGTGYVAEAAVRASVPALVVASSVGAYAPNPKDEKVGEEWPVTGVPGSTYSRDKADVEALLDEVELAHPELRVVRVRPALTFQRSAAAEIARYFIGPLAPLQLLRLGRLPVVPYDPRLRVQAVHADDVAEAYSRAVRVPAAVLRLGAGLTWHARLQPTEPGWIRLAAQAPLLSTARAEKELGWRPRMDALGALEELLDGMARGTGAPAPPLRPRGLAD